MMAETKQDASNVSSQSRVVLAKPRLGIFGSSNAGAANKSSNPFESVLRPAQLKPTNNPFLKVIDENNKAKEKEDEPVKEEKISEKADGEAPQFVPLGSANVTSRTTNPISTPVQPTSSTSAPGFVFGQNLSERVVMKEHLNNGEAMADHSSSNGTPELLFTSVAASAKENNQDEASLSETSNSSEGLAAAAAEYERSHARPPLPAVNCIMTGEEGENNVLQISCRLFAWEAGSWRERGRGVLRLNDTVGEVGASRLVARVAGSLRVILNTKLWPDMVVQKAGTKSLRITAADAQQQIKLFLIMGAPGDINQLHRAITSRIPNSKRPSTTVTVQNNSSQKEAERLEAATTESECIDKHNTDDSCNAIQENEHDATDALNDDYIVKDSIKDDRLVDCKQKIDSVETSVDFEINEDDDSKTLKRKEPAEDETSPKRQCPDISIE